MKLSDDRLAQRLESALSPAAVTAEPDLLARHIVDGQRPALLCYPATAAQTAAVLSICNEAEAAVAPWGGGTAMALGNPPRQLDVVIDLGGLNRLVEHDDANLTATVEAGMSLSVVQETLVQRNQFLPLDPPHPSRATVGGVLATNLSGPRGSYGSPRDLAIGMRVALATGEAIKAGGKVVKNVAGYDMCKLFVGSLGTLGIITEATFRLAPVPEDSATLIAQGSLPDCIKLGEEISSSMLLPTAVTLFNGRAARANGFQKDAAAIAVRTEGFTEAVERHLRDCQSMAQGRELDSEVLRQVQHEHLWNQIRDFGVGREAILYRLTLSLASIGDMVMALDRWNNGTQAAQVIAHLQSGTIWIQTNPTPEGIGWFSEPTRLAQEHNGHAVIIAAPASLKEGIDIWGPAPASLNLMREIKNQFDPRGILNPGRFVAGL
jgi:glycolate dehydrogenase FAD-binding subunit